MGASFLVTDLRNASFYYSNVKRASFDLGTLRGANFSKANLYEANFINSDITGEQLNSALSIQDALLRNRTRTKDKNLINNGGDNCNISRGDDWILQSGNVTVVESNHYGSYCGFVLQLDSSEAVLYQRVNLSNKWNSNDWPYSQVVLRANMSSGVSMELRAMNSNNQVRAREILSKFHHSRHVIKSILYIYI